MKFIDKYSYIHKTVIVRCDLNVSLKNGKIEDDTKIRKSVKTIEYLLDHDAKVIIISHLGRIKSPEDKKNNSLEIVCDCLNKYLDNRIKFVSSLDFKEIKLKVLACAFGKGVMLENTRFYDLNNNMESDCSLQLAKDYASLGDIFVNDAFATIHRKHASNYGISKYLPSAIGFLVKDEIEKLKILDNPERPFVVILGGSKVADKIDLVEAFLKKADKVFIGGAMSFTFLKASNFSVGKGFVDENFVSSCKKLLIKYKDKILLPVDFVGSNSFSDVTGQTKYITDIPDDFFGMDIGKQTIEMLENEISDANTVFWNGPIGVYEFNNYKNGTEKLLKYITDNIKTTVIGGGDIITACSNCSLIDKVSFVSTGGGAALEYLVNKKQPGLSNITK